jgi:ubiquinol-cytochrome c reductase cytochrome b subunit
LLFIAAMVLHMFRNYFTGAFRKPREALWIGGVVLLLLGILEGYLGYSMIDDLLSGEGLRIMSGIVLSIPVVGTWLHWAIFGAEFPGELWIPRFYLAHVLLIPGILLALIAVHLGLVWYQHHTQFPGPGKSERNLVGDRTVPVFASHSAALGLCVIGVLGILGGLAQINPVFNYGPFEPAEGSSGSEPDWYAGFLIGALRVFPRWDINLGNYQIPAPFWPAAALPLLMFFLLGIYPFIEQKLTGDRAIHNLLERPRDNPRRTALGAMAITFYTILLLVGGDDIFTLTFQIPVEYQVWGGRIGLLFGPPLAYLLTRRICRGLQRSDRDILRHGIDTGLVQRSPSGDSYLRVRQPPGGVDYAGRAIPVTYQGGPVRNRLDQLATSRVRTHNDATISPTEDKQK